MISVDRFERLVGELARPYSIVALSTSIAISIPIVAIRISSYEGAGVFVGACFTGFALIYGAKSWENARVARDKADEAKEERILHDDTQ